MQNDPPALDQLATAARCFDLQNQLTLIKHDHQRLINHLYEIAAALGVEEEGFGITGKGIAPTTLLERIKELKEKP